MSSSFPRALAMPSPPPTRRPPRVPLAGSALALASGIAVDRAFEPLGTQAWTALALGLGLAAIAVCGLGRSGRAWGLVLLATFALGGGLHHHRWSDLAPDDLARFDWSEPQPAWLRGVLSEGPDVRAGESAGDDATSRFVLDVSGRNDGRGWRAASGRVLVHADGDRSDLRMGRVVEAVGNLGAIPGPLNPGEPDRRDRWRAEGIRLHLSIDDPSGLVPILDAPPDPRLERLGAIRAALSNRLVARLDTDAAPLADALLLGQRDAIDPAVLDAFARTGTTHLLAISGLHLQALAALVGLALVALAFGSKPSAAVVVGFLLGYAAVVGLMPSVVRSSAMTALAGIAVVLDRQVRASNLLAWAAIVTLAINPAFLFDVGCQLSFLAVAVLLWGVPPLARWLGLMVVSTRYLPEAIVYEIRTPAQRLDDVERLYRPRWRKAIDRAVAVVALGAVASTAVWLSTLPLVMFRFHLVPWMGLLLNIPLVLLSLPTLASTALTMLGVPGAGWGCSWLIGLNIRLVTWGASIPGGHWFVGGPPGWWVAAFYGLLGLAALATATATASTRLRGRLARGGFAGWLALGAVLGARSPLPDRPEATVLAVDHGLSVLVRSPEGRTWLYDCGKMRDPHVGRRVLAPALWASGVRRIDTLSISHADADHYDALPDLLERIHVGEVRVPPGFDQSADPGARAVLDLCRSRGVPVRPMAAGTRLDLGGGLTAEALHPSDGWLPGASDNDRSLVLDFAADGRHLLLTGDLDGAGLAELVAMPRRPIDVLLAPHHGGRSANPAWLYDWAAPRVVVASQRRPLDPEADALAPLERSGLPVLRTWRDGAVLLRWEPTGIVARRWLDSLDPSPIFHLSSAMSSLLFALGSLPSFLSALLAFLAGLLACVLLGVVEFGAWSLVTPGRRHDPSRPDREPPPWEPISADAPDGARLAGAWLGSPVAEGRTVALLHGFAEDRAALVGRAEALADRGWNVAVFDSRGRGGSGGDRTSFGGREADDLVAWAGVLADRVGPDLRLAAWGRSMGAAIALRAAVSDPRLRAVVLEAPYPDLVPTVAAWLRRLRLPGLLAPWMLRRAGRLAGVPLAEPRPIDLAPRLTVPALVVHGTDDRIASPAAARRLADALGGPVEFVEVPGARHTDVFDVGGATLADRLAAFLDRALAAEGGPP